MRILFIALFLIVANTIAAQHKTAVAAKILPADYDTLNYRLVGFSVPPHPNVTAYILELAEYHPQDDGTIYSIPLFKQTHAESRMIATVPAFGKNYMWRVTYMRNNNIIDSTGYHYFSTGYNTFADTAKYRLRVLANKVAADSLHVFLDVTRTMYDMHGNALWFLPNIQGITDDNSRIRDIKVTTNNTITFLTSENAFEIDYNANVLWKGPNKGTISDDTSENYHHEFTKLKNGNYMIIGNHSKLVPVPEHLADKFERFHTEEGNKKFKKVLFGTLIEYDDKGNIVWAWKSSEHIDAADIFTPMHGNDLRTTTHMNAFYFDEENKAIYTSYRDIHRIIKIAYPSGTVLANYGEANNPAKRITGNGMFYGQHSCRISKDGQLYMFNNNNQFTGDNNGRVSSIVFFREPVNETDTLTKTWQFYCDIDTLVNSFSAGGGSVSELDNGNLLVCTSTGRNFIVSKSKRILWDAIVQFYNIDNKWETSVSGYRNHVVLPEQLKSLVIY